MSHIKLETYCISPPKKLPYLNFKYILGLVALFSLFSVFILQMLRGQRYEINKKNIHNTEIYEGEKHV